jgi:hypothetical protein
MALFVIAAVVRGITREDDQAAVYRKCLQLDAKAGALLVWKGSADLGPALLGFAISLVLFYREDVQVSGSGEVLITAVWPIPPVTNVSDEATIRSEVAEAAKKAASQSVERALQIPPGGRAADVGVGGGCYRNRVCGKEWNTHVERGGAPS